MNIHGVKKRYLVAFAASYYIRNVFTYAVFFYTSSSKEFHSLLEVAWENTACCIKHLTVNKNKVSAV